MGDDKSQQAIVSKMIEFLSEHNRGRCVTWDEVLDRPMAALEADPADLKRAGVEDDEDEVPTSAPTASQPDGAADEAAASEGATRASRSSTTRSRGSKTSSTRASSTR